jgi:MFS family permease
LVAVGLWIRLSLTETPEFQQAIDRAERVRLPIGDVLTKHVRALVTGTFAGTATFTLFYLMTVFTLSWGTTALHYARQDFLLLQMVGVVFFGIAIPLSALVADRIGSRLMIILATVGITAFGFLLAPLLGSGSTAGVVACLSVGLAFMGLTYGPLGAALSDLFPTAVRYTGASMAFNLAGIVGASLAPYLATWLAAHHGLPAVGFYLSAVGVVTLVALLVMPRPASGIG